MSILHTTDDGREWCLWFRASGSADSAAVEWTDVEPERGGQTLTFREWQARYQLDAMDLSDLELRACDLWIEDAGVIEDDWQEEVRT
jgi:hypothetical protein